MIINAVETYSIRGLKRKREVLRLAIVAIDSELSYRNDEEVKMHGIFFQGEWHGAENFTEAVRLVEKLLPGDPNARYRLERFYTAKSIPVADPPEAA